MSAQEQMSEQAMSEQVEPSAGQQLMLIVVAAMMLVGGLLMVFPQMFMSNPHTTDVSTSETANVETETDQIPVGGVTNDAVDVDGISALVPWEIYEPSVKVKIDRMVSSGDCAGLDEQWWIAQENSQSVLERTGHSNGELMRYISAMKETAGC